MHRGIVEETGYDWLLGGKSDGLHNHSTLLTMLDVIYQS